MQSNTDYKPEVEYLKALVDGFEQSISKETKKDFYNKYLVTARLTDSKSVPEQLFNKSFIRPIIALQLLNSEKAPYFEDLKAVDVNYILQLPSHQLSSDIENRVFRYLKHPKNRKNINNVYDTLNIFLAQEQ